MEWFTGQLKPESRNAPLFSWENFRENPVTMFPFSQSIDTKLVRRQVGEMMIVVNEVGSVATLCIVMWSSHSN